MPSPFLKRNFDAKGVLTSFNYSEKTENRINPLFDARGRLGRQDTTYPQAVRLSSALASALSIATESIAAKAQLAGATGQKIGEWISRARAEAVERTLP